MDLGFLFGLAIGILLCTCILAGNFFNIIDNHDLMYKKDCYLLNSDLTGNTTETSTIINSNQYLSSYLKYNITRLCSSECELVLSKYDGNFIYSDSFIKDMIDRKILSQENCKCWEKK